MRLCNSTCFLIGLLVLGLTANAYAKEDELPEVTIDGLHLLHDTKLAIVYARPGASLAGYQRVLLLEPYVAFKKNWERDQRSQSASSFKVTSKDVERIKKNLAAEFGVVFRETLNKGGYPVVDEAAEDVLLIRPAIINLDVNAPDTLSAGRGRTYTKSAGEMTLYVEVYDSVSGELLGKALDRRGDNDSAFYTWSSSVTNKAAADRILKGWADILVNALKEAKSAPDQDAEQE